MTIKIINNFLATLYIEEDKYTYLQIMLKHINKLNDDDVIQLMHNFVLFSHDDIYIILQPKHNLSSCINFSKLCLKSYVQISKDIIFNKATEKISLDDVLSVINYHDNLLNALRVLQKRDMLEVEINKSILNKINLLCYTVEDVKKVYALLGIEVDDDKIKPQKRKITDICD
jgi:hypothetical protein